jgi:hypothetical protein
MTKMRNKIGVFLTKKSDGLLSVLNDIEGIKHPQFSSVNGPKGVNLKLRNICLNNVNK